MFASQNLFGWGGVAIEDAGPRLIRGTAPCCQPSQALYILEMYIKKEEITEYCSYYTASSIQQSWYGRTPVGGRGGSCSTVTQSDKTPSTGGGLGGGTGQRNPESGRIRKRKKQQQEKCSSHFVIYSGDQTHRPLSAPNMSHMPCEV